MPPQTQTTATAVAAAATMTTTAAGFRYTPPSYLLRSGHPRQVDKPWNSPEEEEEDLQPVHMMTMKKGTTIDAHFKHRVQKKQNRYRNILKGQEELKEDESQDSFERQMELEVRQIEQVKVLTEVQQAAAVANQARDIRKSRISGVPIVEHDSNNNNNNTVRSLRAQRLRSSLLQRTPEEVDASTKLESRRKAQLAMDRAARQAQRQQEESQMSRFEQERIALKQERLALEQAKQQAALALARQWRHKQDTRVHQDDMDSLEEVLDVPKKKKARPTRRHARHYRKRSTKNLQEQDAAFWEDLSNALRDTGLLQNCVGQCFGTMEAEPDVVVCSDNSESTTPSFQLPQKMHVYAKYRE
jgi:hypothetical protein